MRRILWAVLLLAGVVYFVDLGGTSIWDANEAFYVETPREMLEAHDLLNPSFNYEPRFNKPVLSYWIVAAFYKAFGVSVAVQRIPIAIGALVLIACAYFLARAGCGMRDAGALWAAAGIAANPRLVMFARRIFIDIWISAFMALTLLFFALSERYPERRRLFLVLMYVAVGLGVLTKGPIAVALPGLVFAVYLTINGELRRVTEMMLPAGILIVLAIVVPWYAALYQEHGWTYITSFFVGENVGRYVSGVGFQARRGILFYVPVIFSDSFPLSLFLIPAAVLAWRGRAGWRARDGAGRVRMLLWLWAIVIVAFFSFSHDKQDLYIFPIVPAISALAAIAIARRRDIPRCVIWTTVALAIVLVLGGAGVLYLFEGAGRVYALRGAGAVGAVAIAGGLAALVVARRQPAAALVVAMAAVVALDWVFVLRVLPDFERYKPVPAMSDVLRTRLQPGDVVAHYDVALPSMVYYLRRHVDVYFAPGPFVDAVLAERRMFGVLPAGDYAALQPALAGRACVLDRRQTFDVKLKTVLAREPLPELLLITNDCR